MPQANRKIVIELYDKFFKNAFPKMAARLGIVYTPIEIVDFILQSAEDLLQKEFGEGIEQMRECTYSIPSPARGVFIVRLLQGALIKDEDLERKYREELHANEIILLAYYIAAINIEEAYHFRATGEYEPFEGILLTDSFQLDRAGGAEGAEEIFERALPRQLRKGREAEHKKDSRYCRKSAVFGRAAE